MILLQGENRIMKERIYQYGKYAAPALVGAAVGFGGFAAYDTPANKTTQYKNLQEKVDNLQDENQELQSDVTQLQARPTSQEYQQVVQDRNAVAEDLEDTQEALADATDREGLVDFLPVVVDEDVELTGVSSSYDQTANNGNLGVGDNDDYEQEEYDQVVTHYTHDDGHSYDAYVFAFEDSEDADEYVDEKTDQLEDDYEDVADEDYRVVRDGDTVVVLRGSENASEAGYDFAGFESQYE